RVEQEADDRTVPLGDERRAPALRRQDVARVDVAAARRRRPRVLGVPRGGQRTNGFEVRLGRVADEDVAPRFPPCGRATSTGVAVNTWMPKFRARTLSVSAPSVSSVESRRPALPPSMNRASDVDSVQ